VAKNVILAGMQSVTLHDEAEVTMSDLSSHFYVSESDVGSPRAAACVAKLRALNGMVRVNHLAGELTDEALGGFNMIVAVDQPLAQLKRLGAFCEANNVHMLATATYGLFGYVSSSTFTDCMPPHVHRSLFLLLCPSMPCSYTFCSLGKGHVIIDSNGEDPASGVAVSITNDNPGLVQLSTKDGDKHGLADGDVVVFERVEGMTELNGGAGRKVKVVNAGSFTIEDTTGCVRLSFGSLFQVILFFFCLDCTVV